MTEEYFQTREFCSREYQAWSLNNQISLEPVDEAEEERLQAQHDLLRLLFAHRTNPLLPDSVNHPIHILDCGYGSGRWASEVAESMPDCQVTGLDICPIIVQRNDRPDNFIPEVANLNNSDESFEFVPETFDFVSSRFVAGGLAQARWPSYVTDIRRVLKRGGAAEFIEWDLFFRANTGNGDRLAALRQWTESYLNAIGKGQGDGKKSRQSPPDIASILESSGFVNVTATLIDVPLGDWPFPILREIGQKAREVVVGMLSSLGLFPIIGRAVMSEKDFGDLLERCKQELDAAGTQPHIRLYVCYGEKAR